jgi:hypothetical protein
VTEEPFNHPGGRVPAPDGSPTAPSSLSPHGRSESDAAASGSPRDPLTAALAAAIDEHRVRRVPLQVLRSAFAAHDPTGATSSESRQRLAASLRELERDGKVVVPRSHKLFESHLQPALPTWVERPAAPRPVPVPRPARVWRPDLAAAAALASSDTDFDVLERVDDFLRRGGSTRPNVPHRERSLELFGHEKRLDALLRNRLFTSGALALDLLRCYQAPLPLTAQHTGDPGPDPALLIVENHATYASALRLARDRATAGAAALAVAWGAGNQLPQAIGGISQLSPTPAHVWYFGDLDEDGLRIAADAAAAARRAGLPPVRPAVPLYKVMLGGGLRQRSKVVEASAAWQLTEWLGDEGLRTAAAKVLADGHRIAQESVGYELLQQLAPWV